MDSKQSQRSSTSNFGTFLEKILQSEKSESEPTTAVGSASIMFLRHLKDGPQPVTSLMSASGMGMIDFAERLKELREVGLIEISHPPNDKGEQVQLTAMGQKLVDLG
jgi:predicted transcriptional regulator